MGLGKKKVSSKEFATSVLDTKEPKYAKPKILLIDLNDDCYNNLKAAGYNVQSGTFGTPINVARSGNYYYVPTPSYILPNLDEQEIVIANLMTRPSDTIELEPPGEGASCMWQKATEGVIDPRPIIMSETADKIHRMIKHGGLLILLMSPNKVIKYRWSPVNYEGEPASYNTSDHVYSNWGIDNILGDLTTDTVSGDEVHIEETELSGFLRKCNIIFSCTFESRGYAKDVFIPLARNKYKKPIAAYYENDGHLVLMLPQIKNLDAVIIELLEAICYALRPNLFPHLTGANWLHDPKYEIPEIIELNASIATIQSEAETEINEANEKINKTREDKSYWYTLLNGTGDELVQAVITVLKEVGFDKVIDVDKKISTDDKESEDNELMEDIRIEDQSPWLIIDVKGVNGHPEDDESVQAEKHAMMRMKEWDRTDLQALTIINHQRQKPPLDRDQQAYRKKIIGNAEKTRLGLMTAWDLYKLMRNRMQLNWPEESVLPIFYRVGRIDCVPEHYSPVGVITDVWDQALGIIPELEINIGGTLAFRVDGLFTEFAIGSLQIDDKNVKVAKPGILCGIAYADVKKIIKKKMMLYKVITGAKVSQS